MVQCNRAGFSLRPQSADLLTNILVAKPPTIARPHSAIYHAGSNASFVELPLIGVPNTGLLRFATMSCRNE